jgi:hypothetical protein
MRVAEFTRTWAMPSDTFSVAPIGAFVARWQRGVVVDPFARNVPATYANDLNPDTAAEFHMGAVEFCDEMLKRGVVADCVRFDPPYSPRQISEVYAGIGKPCGMADTQSAVLYAEVRKRLARLLRVGGVALSFGWNSCGFGPSFEMREILLVAHGGAHNDTICLAEVKVQGDLFPPEGRT